MDTGFRSQARSALDRWGVWPLAAVLLLDAAIMPWLAHPYDVAAFLTHADRVYFAHVRAATLWPYGGVALAAVLLSQFPVAAFPRLWGLAPLRISLLKLPMLIADAGTALIVRRCAGGSGGNLWALRYLLDPAVFFVTVVHGQTDALAGVFAVAGIALTMFGKFEIAAVLLGIGTGAKLYPGAFLPLLLAVAYRNGSPRRAALCLLYFAISTGVSLLPVVAGRTAAFAGAFANNSFGAESLRIESASPWALFNALFRYSQAPSEQLGVVLVPLGLAAAELRHRPRPVDVARAAMVSSIAIVMLNPGAHPPFYLWIAGPLVLYCAVARDGLVSAIGAVLSTTSVAMQFCQEGSEEYLLLNFGVGTVPAGLRCIAPNWMLLAVAAVAAVLLVVAAYRQPLRETVRGDVALGSLVLAACVTLFVGVAFMAAVVQAALLNGEKTLGFPNEMNLLNTFAIDPKVRPIADGCELMYDASDLIVYAENPFAAPYGSAALAYTLFAPETIAIRGQAVDPERLPGRFENLDARTVEQRDVRVTREFDVSSLLRPFGYVERFVERPCGLIAGNPLLIYRFDVAGAARAAANRPFWQRFGSPGNGSEGRRVGRSVP
jgi:hypothetical protein